MTERGSKAKTRTKRKKAAPPAPAKQKHEELVIPPPQQSLEALEAEALMTEPSPEELLVLEATLQRDQERQRLLGLAREYPRSDRPLVNPLTNALKVLPGLKATQARVVAQSLKQIADNAHDLGDIVERILKEKHDPGEVAELVLAFQIVTEQLCSYAEMMGEKLYGVFDQAKGLQ